MECISLEELLDSFNVTKVDFLSLDVESHEIKVRSGEEEEEGEKEKKELEKGRSRSGRTEESRRKQRRQEREEKRESNRKEEMREEEEEEEKFFSRSHDECFPRKFPPSGLREIQLFQVRNRRFYGGNVLGQHTNIRSNHAQR